MDSFSTQLDQFKALISINVWISANWLNTKLTTSSHYVQLHIEGYSASYGLDRNRNGGSVLANNK